MIFDLIRTRRESEPDISNKWAFSTVWHTVQGQQLGLMPLVINTWHNDN